MEEELNRNMEAGVVEDATPYGQEEKRTVRDRVNAWGSGKGITGSRLLMIGYALCAIFFIIAMISVVKFLRIVL